MNSALLTGQVTHTRLTPKRRHFAYKLCLFDLDLAELPHVFDHTRLASLERANWIAFRRRDYLGNPDVPLDVAVRDRVEAELGFRPDGRVRLVTQLRTLGYVFNPVSFYLCADAAGRLVAIVAEIHNTPWRERFSYVLDARALTGPTYTFRFGKQFHVSPFWDMEQEYEWRFTVGPASLGVHMTNHQAGRAVFHAGFEGRAQPLAQVAFARTLLRYPLQPLRMHIAIYWHAALLFLKRTPFFTHPKKRPALDPTP